MGRIRKLATFSLSNECINTLERMAQESDRAKSHIVEDLIMGRDVFTREKGSPERVDLVGDTRKSAEDFISFLKDLES